MAERRVSGFEQLCSVATTEVRASFLRADLRLHVLRPVPPARAQNPERLCRCFHRPCRPLLAQVTKGSKNTGS